MGRKLRIGNDNYNIPEGTPDEAILQFALAKNPTQSDPLKEQINNGFGVPGGKLASALFSGAIWPGQQLASTLTGGNEVHASEYFMPENSGMSENLAKMLGSAASLRKAPGAIGGVLGGPAKKFATQAAAKALPSNLSPQELQANLDVTRGTPTGLGDVIGNPFVKKQHENVIAKMNPSASNKMVEAGQAVSEKGLGFLNDLLGNQSPYNIPGQVSKEVSTSFGKVGAEKTRLYNKFSDLSESIGATLSPTNFSKKSNEVSDALKENFFIKNDKEIQKILSDVNKNGSMSIPEATLLKGKFNQYAAEMKQSPTPEGRFMAKQLSDLSRALKDDIWSSIKATGNKDLEGALTDAEKYYVNEFKPYLSKDIYKHVNGQSDPDTIVQAFIMTPRTADRNIKLTKLVDKLPPEKRNLVAYEYFTRAADKDGKLDPAQLNTLIKNLGERQFETLIPDPAIRKSIKDYSRLYSLNKNSVKAMENPMTGQQVPDILGLLAPVASAAVGGGLGGMGGLTSGLMGAGIGMFGSRALGSMATKALTSEKIREALVNQLMKNNMKGIPQ